MCTNWLAVYHYHVYHLEYIYAGHTLHIPVASFTADKQVDVNLNYTALHQVMTQSRQENDQ